MSVYYSSSSTENVRGIRCSLFTVTNLQIDKHQQRLSFTDKWSKQRSVPSAFFYSSILSAGRLLWLITISQIVLYVSLTLRLSLSFPPATPPSVSLLHFFDTRMAAGMPPSGPELLSCREMSARRTTDKRKMKRGREEEGGRRKGRWKEKSGVVVEPCREGSVGSTEKRGCENDNTP